MKSYERWVFLVGLFVLFLINAGCDHPSPTSDKQTESTTIKNTPLSNALVPTQTQNPTFFVTSVSSLFSLQPDSGHNGFVDQALPVAYEPKWLSSDFMGMENYQVDWRVATDGEIVVVTGSSMTHDMGVARLLTSSNSGDTSIIYAFSIDDGEQLWSYETNGTLVGYPQIVDGKVYVVSRQRATDGDEAFASKIHCLRSSDGSVIWSQILPKSNAGAQTVQDGVLVLLAGIFEVENGESKIAWDENTPIHALGFDADTGESLWITPLKNKSSFSLNAPPVVDGRVFVTDGDFLYALDLQTGEQFWQFSKESKEDGDGFTGVLIADDGKVFATAQYYFESSYSYQNVIYTLDATSGNTLWRYDLAITENAGRNISMSCYNDELFTWGSWNQGGDLVTGLIALNALEGSELWHIELDSGIAYPPVIGNNGRLLVTSYGKNWLIEASTGQILWLGERKYLSEMGVSFAQEWRATFTYGSTYANPPVEDWLPNEWGVDALGRSVLLAEFQTWMSAPALSNGLAIGVARHPQHESNNYGLRLIAYGEDTTPPDTRISPIGLGQRNIQPMDIFGTVYDYNLKEWKLELGKGSPPSTWQLLKQGTLSDQTFIANLRNGGKPNKIGDGDWVFRLTATDYSGQTSSDEWKFTNDYTPPKVEITEPTDGTIIRTTTFTLKGSASDTNGIEQVRISSDGGQTFITALGTKQWSLPMEVTSMMSGKTLTFFAEAVDTFGNVARSNQITLTFPKFKVELDANGRKLVSSLSMFIDPEKDIDGDGIDQRWENTAIEMVKPVIELDEEEDWLYQFKDGPKYPVVFFVRTTGYTPRYSTGDEEGHPAYILFFFTFGWSKDWGAAELGTTDILLEAHRGDSEYIVMAWKVTSDTTAQLEWVRTSAHSDANRHHGIWNAWRRSCNLANIAGVNAEKRATEMLCSNLEFQTDGRLILYPGEDKHALYPNAKMCSDDVTLIMFGYGEDCGWNPLTIGGKLVPGQWSDSDFNQDDRYLGGGRWLLDAYNVGEPDPDRKYQLIDFLDQPETWRSLTENQISALTGLYPNEAIWTGNADTPAVWDPPDGTTLKAGNDGGSQFCGGLEDTISEPEKCSSKVGGTLGQANDWTDNGPPDLISNVMNARYEVMIKTGDKDGAGTDAKITMILFYENGSKTAIGVLSSANSNGDYNSFVNQVFAPYINVGTYERGETDYVYPSDLNSGKITGIQLSQDGTGDGPGWFVEQIMVRDQLTGEVLIAYPNRWLAADEEPHQTSAYFDLYPYIPGSILKINYDVIVTTGDKSSAGTDGDVSITMIADDGYTLGPYLLDNENSNDFERNTVGYYKVTAPEIYHLASLQVELAVGGDHPDWYCQEVTIRNTITGEVWVFPVNSWLAKGSGPLKVEVPAKQ